MTNKELSNFWFDTELYQEEIKKIEIFANQIDEQKKFYKTEDYDNDNSRVNGLKPEFMVSKLINIPMNMEIYKGGDGKKDFEINGINFDVKGVTYWNEPFLKENLSEQNNPNNADIYILCALKDNRYVRIAGWSTKEQLFNAKVRDFGHGTRYVIDETFMEQYQQQFLPPAMLELFINNKNFVNFNERMELKSEQPTCRRCQEKRSEPNGVCKDCNKIWLDLLKEYRKKKRYESNATTNRTTRNNK